MGKKKTNNLLLTLGDFAGGLHLIHGLEPALDELGGAQHHGGEDGGH